MQNREVRSQRQPVTHFIERVMSSTAPGADELRRNVILKEKQELALLKSRLTAQLAGVNARLQELDAHLGPPYESLTQ